MSRNVSGYIRKTMLLRLIVYFFLIIIITLFASSYFIYNYFSSSFKSEINSYFNKVLNQVSIISDEFVLKKINELAIKQLIDTQNDSEIISIFNNVGIDDWKQVSNIQQKLDNIAFHYRDVLDTVFIHSRSNDILISSSRNALKYINEESVSELDEYYWVSSFYKSNKSIQWLKTRNAQVYLSSSSTRGDVITFICAYPISSTGDAVKGFIGVNIKEEALSNYLVKFNSSNTGMLMIIDNDGVIVSHSNKASLYEDISKEAFVKRILNSSHPVSFETTFENKKYVVSCIKSGFNNWYYVSLVTTELFYQKDQSIKKRIFLVSAIILFIVLILSNVLSLKIYTPLRKILNKYSTSAAASNIPRKGIEEYNLLDNMFSNMHSKIDSLQESLSKNAMLIKHNLMLDLLNNRLSRADSLENMLNLLNIKFLHKYYGVVIFSFNKEDIGLQQNNTQLYKYKIIDFIDILNNDNYTCIPVDIRNESICVILNTDSIQKDDIIQFINKVEDFCIDEIGTRLITGIGRSVENLYSINASYIDAKMCMQYNFIYPDKNMFYYDEFNVIENTIPEDISIKLDKALRLGSYTEVKKATDRFLAIATCDNIAYREVRREILRFISIFRQFTEDINLNLDEAMNEYCKNRLYHPRNINEFINTFLEMINSTNDIISRKKQNENLNIVNKIKRYVLDNLHMDISLNSTAEVFSISPYHLSRIFKKETQVNYIDYVVTCKIDKAKDLLVTTDYSIEKITELIGYNHSTYLSKKFKELTGKTPNEYRKDARMPT